MGKLFAQPYDLDASGFYFSTFEEYEEKSSECRNAYDQQVEEYEIQSIELYGIDCELFHMFNVSQATLEDFMRAIEDLDESEKVNLIIAKDSGEDVDLTDDPDLAVAGLCVYQADSYLDLAKQFVDDGVLGDIPDFVMSYFDYEAFARDLKCDYSKVTVNGTTYFYT